MKVIILLIVYIIMSIDHIYIYIYMENSDQVVFCEMFIGNSLSCVWES